MGVKKHPHPGKILFRDWMKRQGLTANALALALRVPSNRITAIIKGERAVTADTALRLGRYFNEEPELFLRLQFEYDLDKARKENGTQIDADVVAGGGRR
jgi:addiction module HigA family antidote